MIQVRTASMNLKKTGTLFVAVFAFYGNAQAGSDVVDALRDKLTRLRSVGLKEVFNAPYSLNEPKFPVLVVDEKTDELEIRQLDKSAAVCASATWASMKGIGFFQSAYSSSRWNRAVRNQILPEVKPELVVQQGTVMDWHKLTQNPEELSRKVKNDCESVVTEQTVSLEKYNKQIKSHNDFVAKVMKKSSGFKKALARKLPFLSAVGVYCLVSSCVNIPVGIQEPQDVAGSEKAS